MNFHVLTLFPEMVMQGLHTSIIGKAAEKGLIYINAVNIRDYTVDKHGKVDDYPYGGGAGMLMQAQPVFDAYQAVTAECGAEAALRENEKKKNAKRIRTIYVTPQGKPFTQKMAEELAQEENLVFLCGHYEGIDERVLEEIVTDYVSIGDYVLTGGELPAMVMIDAVSRLVPGVLHNDFSAETESFHNDLLEYPQYSRPEVWHEKAVPEVLLSGNHRKIMEWRLEKSKERTARIRPDLYIKYEEKQKLIKQLSKKKRNHIHLIEALSRGRSEIVCWNKSQVLLCHRDSGIYLISAGSPESGEKLVGMIPDTCKMVVTSQEFLNEMVCEKLGLKVHCQCIQACYTRKETLPVRHKDIRLLGEESLGYLTAHYHLGNREYLLDRLNAKVMYGAFAEERLVGFVGLHDDGSMGLLFVEEAYRGRGIGASLEAYQINRLLELGWTPYCHIFCDNQESMKLQEKLGLYLSEETIWWIGK